MNDNVTAAHIILASASPRRRELLAQIGVRAFVQAVDIDESHRPGESVMSYVQRLAMEKAQRGYETIKNDNNLPILGSDTIVEINGSILGKPESDQQAKEMLQQLSAKMLQQLSAKKHTVHTSVAIVTREISLSRTSSSEVLFDTIDEGDIERYIATGEPEGKAGSYAIQGIAAQFIRNINGSFSGVMGLPLYETAQLLRQCGVLPLDLKHQART